MEFACGFVYVPPSEKQQNNHQQSSAFKRSALLPPVNWIRPRSPPPPPLPPHPPPPPKQSEKAKQSPTSSPKLSEQLENSRVAKVTGLTSTSSHENAEFNRNLDPVRSTAVIPQQTPPPRKTALLPPHMRSAGDSLSLSYNQLHVSFNHQISAYEEPKNQSDLNPQHQDVTPEASEAPPLPPRPPFIKLMPEYLVLLPSSSASSTRSSPTATPLVPSPTNKGSADKEPLPGNPNVVLVSLGKLLSEERVQPTQGEPTSCSQCSSVLDTCNGNTVSACYFCQSLDSTSSPSILQSLKGPQDGLFLLNPNQIPLCTADALLLFCIDVSGSMSITSKVLDGVHAIHKSRLQFVKEAVLQCVQRLTEQQPDIRVGLITFNHQVTVHGYDNFPSRLLSGAELTESNYLKAAGFSFSSPPPLSQTKDCLQRQVTGLSASGATALGPAALLSIAMASRQPSSKVIICTDGKANAELGNLEEEDNDARTLLSSTIFYQELGEYAADQGVTVSVLSIEGTDCRLDELGRLADRTGGKVVIASPNRLHPVFEQIIQNRTIATHCAVTLLLHKSLQMKGEREAGHKGTREVGNVNPDTEITFQFGASEQNKEVPAPFPGSCVSIQLQVRYKQRNGQMMLRVLTADRDVTDDSAAALSSLSLAIIQLNSSQASAALAVRGRFLDAMREGEMQLKLIERSIEHNRSSDDNESFQEWVKTMEPIYHNIHNFTRKRSVTSDSQPLTDTGAALLYTMKHCNRKSFSLKN